MFRGRLAFRVKSPSPAQKTPPCQSSFAALLAEEPVEIQNVPKLKDIDTTMKLLSQLGAKVERNGSVWIDAGHGRMYSVLRTIW